MIRTGFLFFFVFLAFTGFSQNNFKQDWDAVNKDLANQHFKTALTKVQEINKAAVRSGDKSSIVRSELLMAILSTNHLEEAMPKFISQYEATLDKDDPIADAFKSYFLAKAYQRYFDEHHWEFQNRTETDDHSENIADWTAHKFDSVISQYNLATLEPAKLLQQAKVEDYDMLIDEGTANARKDFPSLFDVFARSAFQYFSSGFSRMNRQTSDATIDDKHLFDAPDNFVKHEFSSPDLHTLRAIEILQEWESYKAKSKNKSAAAQVFRTRIDYVKSLYWPDDEDELYETTVYNMSDDYNTAYWVADDIFSKANNHHTITTYILHGELEQLTRLEVRDKLKSMMNEYASDEILSKRIEQMIVQLEESGLQVEVESAFPADEPFLMKVTHRNLDEFKVRIFKIDNPLITDEEILEEIKGADPVREWKRELSEPINLQSKSTEFKVDALPAGAYFMISENDAKNLKLYNRFQSTNITFIPYTYPGYDMIALLDRTTGFPIVGAKMSVFETRLKYNRDLKKNERITKWHQDVRTDEQGKSQIVGTSWLPNPFLRVEHNGETYYGGLRMYTKKEPKPTANIYYSAYTDRAIYRPGQTVYFMIMASKKELDGSFHTLADLEMKVVLRNANYQVVKEITLISDEFGTATTTFQLPEDGLRGNFSISLPNNHRVYIRMEEYKRPKFEVKMIPPTTSQKLEETVRVSGEAVSYAGVSLQDAKVVYRVTRQVRYPFPWCYRPWMPMASQPIEIAHGETVTDENGEFEIEFLAKADKKVPRKSYPIFSYQVQVDVTEPSGETRSGSYALRLSYLPFYVHSTVPMDLDVSKNSQLKFSSKNLQNNPVEGHMEIQIYSLRIPSQIYKDRLWGPIDYESMTEKEFRTHFPHDAYDQENRIEKWKKEKLVFQKEYKDFKEAELDLKKLLKVGAYRIYVHALYQNDTISTAHNFKLKDGERSPDIPFVLKWKKNKNDFKVNDRVKLQIQSKVPKLYTYLTNNRKGVSQEWKYLKKEEAFQYKTSEKDRGTTTCNAYAWYQNRAYASSEQIKLPFTNRKLKIQLETLKDKTKPGAKEQWSVNVRGEEFPQLSSQLLASVYDMSLDAFANNKWGLPPNFVDTHHYLPSVFQSAQINVSRKYGRYSRYIDVNMPPYKIPGVDIRLNHFFVWLRAGGIHPQYMRGRAQFANLAADELSVEAVSMDVDASTSIGIDENHKDSEIIMDSVDDEESQPEADIQVRENLNETAFFYPQLVSDAEGNYSLKFTMPEALTRWKLMMLAHTKDLALGYAEHEFITQKELMITPQLPRYLRQNDTIYFSTRIDNVSEEAQNVTAKLLILDAESGEDVSSKFGIKRSSQNYDLKAEGQATAQWQLTVPNDWETPVQYKVTAQSAKHSDGEIGTLPVITNRILVTESMPLQLRGSAKEKFRFNKMVKHTSPTSENYSYTIEYSGSPIWYAIQSLPYLMDYPYDCSEQVFNKLYATSLAEHVAKSAPEIKRRIQLWSQNNPDALKSNLNKNQELKSALIEETPWVRQAKSEEDNMKNLVLLFDDNHLQYSYAKNIDILRKRQLPSGAFSWFPGGHPNEYITAYIACGIHRLEKLGVDISADMKDIPVKARPFIYAQMKKRKEDRIRYKNEHCSTMDVFELYLLSFVPKEKKSEEQLNLENYFLGWAKKEWTKFNKQTQARIAIVLKRKQENQLAASIMKAFDESAIMDEEKGMYWKDFTGDRYYWYQAPIEGMATMIEAYQEVKDDKPSADEQRIWLLKNKQVNAWKTTKATADACYALLYENQALEAQPTVTIKIADQKVKSQVNIPGMEYTKRSYTAAEITPDFQKVEVDVRDQAEGAVSWGAVYWQYFEDLDKVPVDADNPLHIEKKVYIKKHTDEGEKLFLVKDGQKLEVGDKLTIRMLITSDRDMSFVHIKDVRAGCVEPVDVLSGYRWGPLPAYMSTRDISTNFFADHLRQGNYVLEYDAFVNQKGKFSMGMASVQCMYSPEYGAHSQGSRVEVE